MRLKNYDELFFTDDFFFCKIMRNESICKKVIRTLTGLDAEEIHYIDRQKDIKPDYRARGVRLDIRVRGSGRMYDLEMQPRGGADLSMRARYYQSLMDLDYLEEGRRYAELPESIVVFISLTDPFGLGLPRYTLRQTCAENPGISDKINDKTLKVFYNAGAWKNIQDQDVQTFLKFLLTKKPQNDLTEEIMEAVEIARHNEPWRIEFNTLREMREEQKADDDEYYGKIIEEKDAELIQKDAEISQQHAALSQKDETISQKDAELERLRAENAALKAQNRRTT